jgi:hypothetical protein
MFGTKIQITISSVGFTDVVIWNSVLEDNKDIAIKELDNLLNDCKDISSKYDWSCGLCVDSSRIVSPDRNFELWKNLNLPQPEINTAPPMYIWSRSFSGGRAEVKKLMNQYKKNLESKIKKNQLEIIIRDF